MVSSPGERRCARRASPVDRGHARVKRCSIKSPSCVRPVIRSTTLTVPAAETAALQRFEDAETAQRVWRVYVAEGYTEGTVAGSTLIRFTELRALHVYSLPDWLARLSTHFPRLEGVSCDVSNPSIFDTSGLLYIATHALRESGQSTAVSSAHTLRALTISPAYELGQAGLPWHDRGLFLLVRTAMSLQAIKWTNAHPVEVEQAFVGRETGRLRTLALMILLEDPRGHSADVAAVIKALPSSLRQVGMTFERAPRVIELGTSFLGHLSREPTFLPDLDVLAIGPCGEDVDEGDDERRTFVATEARAREVAASRGIERTNEMWHGRARGSGERARSAI